MFQPHLATTRLETVHRQSLIIPAQARKRCGFRTPRHAERDREIAPDLQQIAPTLQFFQGLQQSLWVKFRICSGNAGRRVPLPLDPRTAEDPKLLVSWAEPYQGQPRRKRCPRKSEVWMGSWLVATTLMPIEIGYNLLLVRILGESRRLGTHRFC